jgi:O-acetylserine/cysteine efflux transporter
MPITHLLLALLVVVIWGINFLFVKLGLQEISPLLLCAARFILASLPAVFFIKPPNVPFRIVAAYGLIMFALQFSLVFLGMYFGMTPGMASIIMQVQVFFSMFFAAVLLKEFPKQNQIMGALVAFVGIGVVAAHINHFNNDISLLGLLCLLGAAATWGFGNLITKKTKNTNMMALVVWSSLIAAIPMVLISLFLEGPHQILTTFQHLTWKGWSSIIYIVYASTWVGYGVWNWVLSRHAISTIVPLTLLVPIVGMLSSVIFMGEPLQFWKLEAGVLVLAGLGINLLSSKMFSTKKIVLRS